MCQFKNASIGDTIRMQVDEEECGNCSSIIRRPREVIGSYDGHTTVDEILCDVVKDVTPVIKCPHCDTSIRSFRLPCSEDGEGVALAQEFFTNAASELFVTADQEEERYNYE